MRVRKFWFDPSSFPLFEGRISHRSRDVPEAPNPGFLFPHGPSPSGLGAQTTAFPAPLTAAADRGGRGRMSAARATERAARDSLKQGYRDLPYHLILRLPPLLRISLLTLPYYFPGGPLCFCFPFVMHSSHLLACIKRLHQQGRRRLRRDRPARRNDIIICCPVGCSDSIRCPIYKVAFLQSSMRLAPKLPPKKRRQTEEITLANRWPPASF